jgi:preprotein translocase subunit YajC
LPCVIGTAARNVGDAGFARQGTTRKATDVFLADSSQSSGLLTILPFVLIIGAMYFLILRPQNKRRREAQEMQSKLGPGDDVQTVGGLFGTVTEVDTESVTIEAAPGVELRFARGAVARVVARAATADDTSDDDTDASRTIEQG